MKVKKRVFIQLDSGRGYSRQLLKGIYDYNNHISHWGIILQSAYYQKPEDFSKVNIDIIKAHRPDGLILSYCSDLEKLLKLNIPIVQTTSLNKNRKIPFVLGNYDADSKLAIDYFLSIGFSNIGFFGVNNLSWAKGRYGCLKKYTELNKMNFFVYNHKTNLENINYSKNLNMLVKWLLQLPKPIGFLACNDDFGQVLINACLLAKLRVPQDVAVLGVDNDELICNITYPNMSSISRNLKETAFSLCELLDRMMDGEKLVNVRVYTQPVEVVVRQSTDTIASQDGEVIKAITFIRENVHSKITVDDVVQSTFLSKRRLYARFKAVTGHSINREIQLGKLSRFKQLLRDTQKSVGEIGYEVGLGDVTHVSRWFANIEGKSPSVWREENIY